VELNKSETVDILLIEDNPADAHLIELSIEDYDETLSLHWIENGEDALNYLKAEGEYSDPAKRRIPRLIILDLKLPRYTGNEILQTRDSWKELDNVPIVMHSSSQLHQEISFCLKNGASDFFVKSIELSDFFDDCHKIFNKWLK
jgi:two-component system response regulator